MEMPIRERREKKEEHWIITGVRQRMQEEEEHGCKEENEKEMSVNK